jgi:hypothetical protein
LISIIYIITTPVGGGGEHGTGLQAALFHHNLEMVALLLEKRADPNIEGASFQFRVDAVT